MKRYLTTLFIAAVALLTAQAAFAAVDSTDILIKALVEKKIITEEEASAVRAEIATIRQEEEAGKKSFNVTAKRPIKVSGYVQNRYTYSDDKAQNAGFEVKRLRLSLAGDTTPVVDYKFQVDFAGSRKAVTSVDATDPTKSKTDSFGRPTLLDAVIGYRLPAENRLSAGQFYVPFGLESTTSDALLDTINRSQTTEKLVPGRDTGNQGRDIGVQFSGIRPLNSEGTRQVEYAVAVLNGAGINTGDDNRRKDIATRLIYKPGIDGLSLGASYYDGALGKGQTPHRRTGFELVYLRAPWTLKSEYIEGKDDVRKSGFYTTLVRQLGADTQAVFRYDHVSQSAFKASDSVKPTKVLTLGVNWFLSKDTQTRLSLNYEHKREDGTQVPNDQVLAQLQASY